MGKKKNNYSEFLDNKQLNIEELREGKYELKSRFTSLICTLTSHCNIQCIMCGIWREKWNMPEKTVRGVVDYLKYLEHAIWLGGEVFLSPYFGDLLDETKKYPYLEQRINTNALLINEKWAEKLMQNNIELICSIDSTTKEPYEKIRKGGKFKDLLKALEIINEMRQNKAGRRFDLRMNMVVMKSNWEETEHIIDFAYKYGFENVQLIAIAGDGNPEQVFDDRPENKKIQEKLKRVIPVLKRKAEEYGIELFNCLPLTEAELSKEDLEDAVKDLQKADKSGRGYDETYDIEDPFNQKELKETIQRIHSYEDCTGPDGNGEIFCRLAWQQLLIEPFKCQFGCWCPRSIGTIEDKTIDEIWNSKTAQRYRKAIVEGNYNKMCGERCVSCEIPAAYKLWPVEEKRFYSIYFHHPYAWQHIQEVLLLFCNHHFQDRTCQAQNSRTDLYYPIDMPLPRQ
ncbi:radical SAM/SPASM domain-containing protein [Elusimicrobiota bacterium]